jgi:hypothetical protein
MYVCMHACMCIHMCILIQSGCVQVIQVCARTYACMHVYTYVHSHTVWLCPSYAGMCMHAYVYICAFVHSLAMYKLSRCAYACMYACTYRRMWNLTRCGWVSKVHSYSSSTCMHVWLWVCIPQPFADGKSWCLYAHVGVRSSIHIHTCMHTYM